MRPRSRFRSVRARPYAASDETSDKRFREGKQSGIAASGRSRRAFDRRRQSVQVIDSIYVAVTISAPGQLSSRLFSKHVIARPADVLTFIRSSNPPRVGRPIRFYE